MKRYQLGIYEKAMPNDLSLEEKIIIAKKTNFDYMEISIDETDEKLSRLDCDFSTYNDLLLTLKNENMKIKTMCLSGHRKYPLGSNSKEIREKGVDIMEKALRLADLLNVRIIQLAGYDVYYENSNDDTVKYFRENLQQITLKAASFGINLGFETMETSFMDTVEKTIKYVNLVNSPYLGIYPDIGNLKNASVKYGHDLISDLKLGDGKIFASHLKETTPGIFRDLDFGVGHTDYSNCIHELSSQGVRLFTGEFWYKGEKNYTEKIKNANIFLREQIEKNL